MLIIKRFFLLTMIVFFVSCPQNCRANTTTNTTTSTFEKIEGSFENLSTISWICLGGRPV